MLKIFTLQEYNDIDKMKCSLNFDQNTVYTKCVGRVYST
jgi:hypothetical protein